jgi:hypothetical protein
MIPDPVRPTFLVTGGGGRVGWEHRRTLATLGSVVAPFHLVAEKAGIYHLTAAGETTWYLFARLS